MTAAVILAAGLSSRMGDFKPLMRLNGFSLVQMAVDSAKSGGATKICVVLGKRADEVKKELSDSGVSFVINERYTETDMLHSVKLGLREVIGCDAAFVLPADTPLVSPKTYAALSSALTPGVSVCFPFCQGEAAHPPLISSACFETILGYEGEGGLHQALRQFKDNAVCCNIEDDGALLDADTPEDFEKMKAYAMRTKGITREMCYSLMEELDLAPHIRAHCVAVANLAVFIAENLIRCGYGLDLRLIESAALLHDLLRTESKHAEVAAAFIKSRGYDAIADIIRVHMRLEDGFQPHLDEAMVVFLADKMAKRDKFISIEGRYKASLLKYPDPDAARPYVTQQTERALQLKALYEKVTNNDLYEQCRNVLSQA